MGIQVEWDNAQKTAIRLTYSEPWTWEEYKATFMEGQALLTQVDHRVDFIFDISNSGFPPAGVIGRLKKLSQKPPGNQGKTIFVGATPGIRVLINTLFRLWCQLTDRAAPAFVATVEEARGLL